MLVIVAHLWIVNGAATPCTACPLAAAGQTRAATVVGAMDAPYEQLISPSSSKQRPVALGARPPRSSLCASTA